MSDLATERAAAMKKRDDEKAEQILRARARHVRQAMGGTGPRARHHTQPKTHEEAARLLFPNLPDDELAKIVAAADEPVDRGRTVSTIETSRVREITKAYLQKNPDATSRDAWNHVLQHGQPTIKEATFPAYIVSDVRKELGISVGSGPKPKSEGALPSRPRPRRRDEAERPKPSKKERLERLKRRAATQAVDDDVRTGASAPKTNGNGGHAPALPVADEAGDTTAGVMLELVEPRRMAFQDGDRITIEIGGEKLDARRMGGRWTCDVGDSVLEGFLGRVLAGVGR